MASLKELEAVIIYYFPMPNGMMTAWLTPSPPLHFSPHPLLYHRNTTERGEEIKNFPYDVIFPSVEMVGYYKHNLLELEELVEAIQGAPIPLAHKLQLIISLDKKEFSCVVPIYQLTRAMEEMSAKLGEIFLLKYCWNDTWMGEGEYTVAPCFTMEQVVKTIREHTAKVGP